MLADIVVDTNVLMHADNDAEPRQDEARAFLLSLLESATKLCVDEGFDIEESKNRSHIGSEYLQNLHNGMLGFAVIQHLASFARVSTVSRTVPTAIARKIRMHVRSSRDRVFVRVAFNADDRTLVSHDFTDIPQGARNALVATINVQVLSADEALPMLG